MGCIGSTGNEDTKKYNNPKTIKVVNEVFSAPFELLLVIDNYLCQDEVYDRIKGLLGELTAYRSFNCPLRNYKFVWTNQVAEQYPMKLINFQNLTIDSKLPPEVSKEFTSWANLNGMKNVSLLEQLLNLYIDNYQLRVVSNYICGSPYGCRIRLFEVNIGNRFYLSFTITIYADDDDDD